MDNEKYRKVIDEINQCHYPEDKVGIIKEHIQSLEDLHDILLDSYLTTKDVNAVLSELSIPELSAFSKKYMAMLDIDSLELREQEQVLRKRLHDFILGLPHNQQDLIEKTSASMEYNL